MDLTANRLKQIDDRLLALRGALPTLGQTSFMHANVSIC